MKALDIQNNACRDQKAFRFDQPQAFEGANLWNQNDYLIKSPNVKEVSLNNSVRHMILNIQAVIMKQEFKKQGAFLQQRIIEQMKLNIFQGFV